MQQHGQRSQYLPILQSAGVKQPTAGLDVPAFVCDLLAEAQALQDGTQRWSWGSADLVTKIRATGRGLQECFSGLLDISRVAMHEGMAADIRAAVIAGRRILDVKASNHAEHRAQLNKGSVAVVHSNAQYPWRAVLSVHRFMMESAVMSPAQVWYLGQKAAEICNLLDQLAAQRIQMATQLDVALTAQQPVMHWSTTQCSWVRHVASQIASLQQQEEDLRWSAPWALLLGSQVLSEQQAAHFIMPWHDNILPDMNLMMRMIAYAALKPPAAARNLQLLGAELRQDATPPQEEQPSQQHPSSQFEDWDLAPHADDCCSSTSQPCKQEDEAELI